MSHTAELASREPEGWLSALDPLSARGTRARLLGIGLLLALSALPLLLLSPLLQAPFEPDEGVYATIARGWSNGEIPYRDLWDNKAPLLFLWYMASFAWLGETEAAPRVLAGLAAGATVPFVWLTARTLFGRREATLAAAVFALSFLNLYIQVTANSEVFMLLPLTAGLFAFAMGARGHGLWWFAAAGALTSLAVFTRQSAVWTFIGYSGWLAALYVIAPEERRRHVASFVALAAGGALAAIPFVVYFAAHGALYELWHAMFEFNFAWNGRSPFYMKLVPPLILNPVPLVGGLVFWGLALVGVWRLALQRNRIAWLALVFLAFSEVATQMTGKLFPHYSVQLLPGAALAAGVGIPYVYEMWRQGYRWLGYAVTLAAGVTLGAAAFVYFQPSAQERFEVQYWYRDNATDAIDARVIAAEVAALTEPGDYVYEWGRESEIYWLADRQPGSRWLHNRAYTVDKSVVHEVVGDLEETKPKLVLITLEEDQIESGDYEPPEALGAYLDEHYRYRGLVVYAEIYERVE